MTRSRYYLKFADPSGQVFDVVDNFITFSYSKRLNDVGAMTIQMAGDYDGMADLSTDNIVTVQREKSKDVFVTQYALDFGGVYRGSVSSTDRDGRDIITLYVADGMSFLARTIVAFKVGITDRSVWTNKKTDQVLKDLIAYNLNLSDVNRLLPLQPGASFSTSSYTPASAVNIDYNAAYKNLLTAMQEVAAIAGDYWYLEKATGENDLFNWKCNFGTDRTSTMLFDLNRANMLDTSLDKRRLLEPTKALVAGQGEGSARATAVRTSANYGSANHTENFVDARDATTTAQLEARGDARLAETEYKPKFIFRASQSPGSQYGQDYGLGDLIKARYNGEIFTQRIVGVTVAVEESGRETIELDIDDV